ncbi:MAG: hypothetical protein ACI9KE_006441, partial [Polyangiales bacterium]
MPQPPQLALLVVEVSQPLRGLPSQSAKPGLQLATVQLVPSQPGIALRTPQMRPHPPQSSGESSMVSHPLSTFESQSPKPSKHRSMRQLPSGHSGSAFSGAQTLPHPPQLPGTSRGASQPLVGSSSQSAHSS